MTICPTNFLLASHSDGSSARLSNKWPERQMYSHLFCKLQNKLNHKIFKLPAVITTQLRQARSAALCMTISSLLTQRTQACKYSRLSLVFTAMKYFAKPYFPILQCNWTSFWVYEAILLSPRIFNCQRRAWLSYILFGRPFFDPTEMRHDWAKTCFASQHDTVQKLFPALITKTDFWVWCSLLPQY